MRRRDFLFGLTGASIAIARPAAASPGVASAEAISAIAGETLMLGFEGADISSPSARGLADQIRRGAVGGVVFIKDNIGARSDVLGLTGLFAGQSDRKVILAIDHEGGAVQRLVETHGCARVPSAERVAADYTVESAEALYAEAGRDIARLGFNFNLAPVVDLANPANPAIGAHGRSFSADVDRIEAYARAFLRGFSSAGVGCALKHFPGQGGALADSHWSLPDISASWSEADLAPFRRLARNGGALAMLSGFVLQPTGGGGKEPAALSRDAVTGLMRDAIGFAGVAMTDDLDMGALGWGAARRDVALRALRAGNDLLMIRNRANADPDLPGSYASWIAEALAEGTLTFEAIEASAERVRQMRTVLGRMT
jgi:beta-N-acetylhexosaminidase